MTYRKFKADHLFTGQEMADPDSVLIITEDGRVQAILPSSEAGEDTETFRGLLSPGFVNCHCHLELSHMRGVLPEKTGLVDFLLAVMRQRNVTAPATAATTPGTIAPIPVETAIASPTGRPATPADLTQHILSAMTAAEEEMLDNGIVAVGDICNTAGSLPIKTAGRLRYHNFIETMGFIEQSAPDRFESSRQVFHTFAEAYNLPIEANSIVPHAPYSVSPSLFRLIANFPGNHILTIHNQETEAENEFYRTGKRDFTRLYAAMGIDTAFFTGTGKRSLESYLPHFYRGQSLILVHNVATIEEDLRFALAQPETKNPKPQAPNLFFCLCPNANLYISGQLPDIDLLIRHGCPIVIGTDSLASNHGLSILEEIKTLQQHFPHLPTATLLQWATHNGAKAVQLDSVLGSFTKGRQPGVLLIENIKEGKFTPASGVKRLV